MADMAAKGRSEHGQRTHCPHGHPYDAANTYIDKRGGRHCRACSREYMRRKLQISPERYRVKE
jgi:hypothetical protein